MADKNVTLGQLKNFAEKADARLDVLELAKMAPSSISIAATGWANDSGDVKYPFRYTLTVEGVTTASRADVVLDAESVEAASKSGVCAVSETAANTVIFKSRTAPASDLTGTIYVYKKVVKDETE